MEKFSDNPGQAAKQVDCINASRRYEKGPAIKPGPSLGRNAQPKEGNADSFIASKLPPGKTPSGKPRRNE